MSGGLPPAPDFADLSRRLRHASLGERWKRRVHRSSLPSPPGPEMDCLGHAIRVVTEGRSSGHHFWQSTGLGHTIMMNKLLEIPGLRGLLPFGRATYGQPTCYKWNDRAADVHQHEGGEHGDLLTPLLLSLAIHNALRKSSCMWEDQDMEQGKHTSDRRGRPWP